jgi:hypothetical protein
MAKASARPSHSIAYSNETSGLRGEEFLIEIKSRPGRISGDNGTWTWHVDMAL